jgi:predicted phage terminase large subunit-like protein
MRSKKKITKKANPSTMRPEAALLYKTDFASFVRKAYAVLHGGARLGTDTLYIEYTCTELTSVATGECKRAVVSMPPRHLKTFICSICLPAWVIMQAPSTKVMVVAGNEKLVKDMAYQARAILESQWYKELSGIELAQDRNQILDFATPQGGGVIAFSIDGSITGRGADLIIVDDPVDIKQASDFERFAKVNGIFHNVILSRLNNPKTGRILVVAHRLHPNDLSGTLLKAGGWRHVMLPLEATQDTTHHTSHGPWHRKAGELLRPDEYDEHKIEELRANTHNPDFETFYQQDVSGGLMGRISRDHFPRFEPGAARGLPVVLSIDPGQSGGPNNSFSVIQAWCWDGENYYLVDRFREQCGFEDFRRAYWRFVRRYRPSVALIEMTGYGTSLRDEVKRKAWPRFKPITPDPRRSKKARLRQHLDTILACRIRLPSDADWAETFISECVEFPGRFDDQVDALTQALDFFAEGPELDQPPSQGGTVVALKSVPVSVGPQPRKPDGKAPGVVAGVSRHRRYWN